MAYNLKVICDKQRCILYNMKQFLEKIRHIVNKLVVVIKGNTKKYSIQKEKKENRTNRKQLNSRLNPTISNYIKCTLSNCPK